MLLQSRFIHTTRMHSKHTRSLTTSSLFHHRSARDREALQYKPRKGQSQEDDPLREPLLARDPSGFDRRAPEVRRRPSKREPGLLDWWFSKPPMAHRPKIPGVVPQKAEPKTFFANERTFLSWLHMALTMGSISAAMLGFSATGSTQEGPSETGIIALILLPVALLICVYALLVFHWRAQAIRNKDFLYYDDRRGPLALTIVVVAALTVIFFIALFDFIDTLVDGDANGAHASSPKDWFRSTLFYNILLKPGRS